MFATPFRRSALALVAAFALAIAGAAVAPSSSTAAPNQGGGGESAICKTLLERMKRYHAISKDRKETKAVRDFYAAQARVALEAGKRNKCQWAQTAAVPQGTLAVGGDLAIAGTAATADHVRAKRRFERLTSARRAQRPAPLAGGPTGTQPAGSASIAAIKAQPTGDRTHDEYCRQVAALIEETIEQGNRAFNAGDHEGAQAWWDLADDFIDRATRNGCRFMGLHGAAGQFRPPVSDSALTTRP